MKIRYGNNNRKSTLKINEQFPKLENSLLNEDLEIELFPDDVLIEKEKALSLGHTFDLESFTISLKYIDNEGKYLTVKDAKNEIKKLKDGKLSISSTEKSDYEYMYTSITIYSSYKDNYTKKRNYIYSEHKWSEPGRGIDQPNVDWKKDVVYNAWGVGPTTQSDSSRAITAYYLSTWDHTTRKTLTKSQLSVDPDNGPYKHVYQVNELIQPNNVVYALEKVNMANYTDWYNAGSIGQAAAAETGYIHGYSDFSFNVNIYS